MIFRATRGCNVSNGYSTTVPTLQRCVVLKNVVANRPCNITFRSEAKLLWVPEVFSSVERLSATKMLRDRPQAEEGARKSFLGGSV